MSTVNTTVHIDFYLAARSEKSRAKILAQIKRTLNRVFIEDVFEKEDCLFQVTLKSDSWELMVFRLLQSCQSLGSQWILTGDINFEFNAWSNQPIIMGIESIGVSIENPMVISSKVALRTPEL
jgi:hypothetical protein